MRRVVPCLALLAAFWLGGCQCASRHTRPTRDPSVALRTPIGTNLDFLSDWTTATPFVDLMKTSREWIPGRIDQWEGGPPLDVDERGWVRSLRPGQVARTLMAWDITTHPAGRYVVLWEGSGELEYFAGARNRRVESESRPRRDVLDIDPQRDGAGFGLMIVRTDPADPIRNIRVLMPGGACSEDDARYCDAQTPCGDAGECRSFEDIHATQIFHPEFLRSLQPYAAIRFMNWADANSTLTPTFEERWSDRVEVEDARWAPRAPLEIMIELSNRLHAEPWISLPSRADDDYARRAGALFRERLDPSLRVWVEYSNEVWNSMFPQYQYAEQRGRALGLSSDAYEAVLRFYSRRTGELHSAFLSGFDARERMVRVYAAQAGNPWVAETVLEFEDAASRADALAIAPYFGHTVFDHDLEDWARLDLDAFFAREPQRALAMMREHVTGNLRVARDHGLPLVAYEGGQHYVGYARAQEDPRIERLFAAANRDPRMEALYLRYLDTWRELGGGLLMHHVDIAGGGRYGYWGASEWLGQPLEQTPKRRAILRWAEQTRAPQTQPPQTQPPQTQEPQAQTQEPQAQTQEPQAQTQEPQAQTQAPPHR